MRVDKADSPAALAEQELRERDLIALVAELVRELHPQRIRFIDILPSSRIERDLGIDSLGRTELILRIERAFRVRLSAPTIGGGRNRARPCAGAGTSRTCAGADIP
jgi:acyl carrier protein